MYQKLVAKIEGKPEERILSYLMLRSLKQARYSAENEGHFALAADTYTHFTSPIRRYPDLMVHRLLTRLDRRRSGTGLAGRGVLAIRAARGRCRTRTGGVEESQIHGGAGGRGFRRADHQHREVRPVRGVDTICSSKAWCPSTSLPGDQYTYHENVRKIVGKRTRREFSIGDKVRVILDRVDGVERKLQFSLLEETPPKKRTRRG